MTTTAPAKPKGKFSSRNLSAVFKAPLRTKPLPDNATGPLQRPNNRMLVLGRTAVAAPAPLNTPSLKKESEVHDTHVNLVPAASNWAEQTEKPKESAAAEPPAAPAEVAVPAAAPEKAWTPESVEEHLHTGTAVARPKVAVESCGRWGDDAVEQDIVRNDIQRQRQREREFPDLKEAVEEAKMHPGDGHAPGHAVRSPSLGPQQPEQHHGRATGRWAHFNEQEEIRRPMHEDRWSQDRYGRGDDDHRSRDRYSRGDDRWSRDRYSRYDDGYERERRPLYESARSDNTISPVPNDSRTHFSRSDARFDIVASGASDRVLSHSPHRMDWDSGRLGRRDGRSPSSARLNEPVLHQTRSRTHSPASTSPSPAPRTPPLAADATPARKISWRNLSSPDHEPGRAWGTPRPNTNAWSKDDEPHTPVAVEAGSSTEASSNSSANSSPNPSQQVQLLKRPKLLFDPKTGSMVNTEDSARAGKRHATNEGGERETASASKVSDAKRSGSQNVDKTNNAAAACHSKVDTNVSPSEENEEVSHPNDGLTTRQVDNTVIALNSVEVATKEVTSSAKHAIDGEDIGTTLKPGKKVGRASGVGNKSADAASAAKPIRKSRSKESKTNAGKATDRSKRGVSGRNDRRSAAGSKATQNGAREVMDVDAPETKVEPKRNSVPKQSAKMSPDADGFKTAKTRRVVSSEKKQRREGLAHAEPAARASEFTEEKKSAHASQEEHPVAQSKGEEVHESTGMATKAANSSKSRRGGARKHRGSNAEQATKDRKPSAASKQQQQPKPSARAGGQKSKQAAKATAERSKEPSVVTAQPAAASTEQVAGEPPAESPLSKKRSQKETKRELRPSREKQGGEAKRPSNERNAPSNVAAREPEPAKRPRAVTDKETKPRGAAAKARPKQVRQVYVVKTPASATSTAA
ncbi:unnamed protein product [Phytophthora fragariaefolia]|uniref:Unnamed protein product n=1 Tax=Phytophthora fragariaefolia TaxID=1490495 RepID=A0A9W6XHZ9_9STRA|nr:unnamed protein product [Phytophthora fragariaefolia]